MDNVPPTGTESYAYLHNICDNELGQSLAVFLNWHCNKDVFPTLEAMQKMIEFYYNKETYMLKLGCTLPKLANICLHKSTGSKIHPFTETDEDLLERIREYTVAGPSRVFIRKALVDEIFIRESKNLCKSIVVKVASQIYPYSICHPVPTGLYTRWEYESETQRFTTRRNKLRSFENMLLSCFQRLWLDSKNESNVTTHRQKKIGCFSVDGNYNHYNTVFEAMGCNYQFCPCQDARPFLSDEDLEKRVKKVEQDQTRRDYIR